MSTFSKLKEQRKEKEDKSCTGKSIPPDKESDPGRISSTSPMDVDRQSENIMMVAVQPASMRQKSYQPEGLYGSLPVDLRIRVHMDETGKGRGIYNLGQRKPGDVLLAIKPHVAALSNKQLGGHCSNCFGAGDSLRRCTSCKVLYYCDSACQRADWTLHKQECAAIERWMTSNPSQPSIPSDAIRCLGRILRNKHKRGKDSVWVREIDGLQSHRTSLNKDPGSRDSQVHAQLAHAVVRFLGLTSPQEMAEYGMDSAADLLDIVSRFATNTFTISTPALTPLGACVSPVVALLNHSCDPNAIIVFPRVGKKYEEPQMQVVALKHISPNEEILTAYIDTTLSRDDRQKQLRETYYFTCHCRLCSPPADGPVDLREAMFCPNKCGGVCLLPTEADNSTCCSKCKAAVKDTDAIIDAVRIGQEALEKAEALQSSNPQKSIQLTTKLVPILTTAGLVPAAHPLLALSRLNASLLITYLPSIGAEVEGIVCPTLDPLPNVSLKEAQEALDEAIRAATCAFTGLSQILPVGHPARGVALAELGKLLCVDEPLPKDAEPTGMRALTPPLNLPFPFPSTQFAAYPPSGPERLKLAYGTLVQASGELKVGFGSSKNEGGEVGKSVRKLAADVEKELSVWKEGIKDAFRDAMQAAKG